MKRGASSLYAQLHGAVRRDPHTAALFLFCASAHGVAHGALALAAGALVRALALGLGAVDGRSTALLAQTAPLTLAVAGVGAAMLKGAMGVVAARAQARLVGLAGQELRQRTLAARLSPRATATTGAECQLGHDDHGPAPQLPPALPAPPSGADPDVARGVASLTTHVREVELAISAGLLQAVRALGELVPVLGVLVLVDARLAGAALLVLAPFSWGLGRMRRAWKRRQALALQESEALFAAADEAIRHADLFRVYRAEAVARAKVERLGVRLTELGAALAARAALLSSANEVLAAVALVLVVGASARWSPAERASLLPFAVAFFLIYKPLRDLSDARLAWAKGEVALARLASVGEPDLGAPRPDAAGIAPHTFAPARLEVRGLRLTRGALCNPVSFAVEPGTILGIVAPTGHGKTTLLRVLLGLERPASGVVGYGDVELGPELGPGARPFAWVPQDAPLIAGTLAENVGLGHPDGGAGLDVAAVLGELGATELARGVGAGGIGAGGRALSGGERQWVALARAFAARRPVLLLDEPTSGLDPESQRQVLGALARLRGQRTVVLVTHRTETLAVCDQIVSLD